MRSFILAILLLSAGSAAAGNLPELLQSAPESWAAGDVEALNARVAEAVAEDESWPRSPLLLALHLIGGDEDTRSLVIEEVKNRGEGADETKVVCIRDGLLDDSIRGDWWEFDLRRLANGTWRVSGSRSAIRCRRGANTEAYQGKPCP